MEYTFTNPFGIPELAGATQTLYNVTTRAKSRRTGLYQRMSCPFSKKIIRKYQDLVSKNSVTISQIIHDSLEVWILDTDIVFLILITFLLKVFFYLFM